MGLTLIIMNNIVKIGIDPDVEKNGVAIKHDGKLTLHNLKFFELFDLLKTYPNAQVVIEGGWLNKSNWHTKRNGSAALNAKIGNHTGANHEVGRKIVEMCEYLDIDYRVVRPTKSKVKSDLFHKITGIKKSNQEQRDAAMLIL